MPVFLSTLRIFAAVTTSMLMVDVDWYQPS